VPNPFMRLGTPNQSGRRKGPDNMGDVEEAGIGVGYTSGVEVPIPPEGSHSEPHVNAYRGTETHGVTPTVEWHDVNAITPDDALVEFEIPESVPDPIPVRIVQSGGTELKRATVQHSYAQPGIQSRIVGRDVKRTTCKITNLHATDTVYISPDPSVQPFTGYPIKAGIEFTYGAHDALYAIAGSTNAVELAVYSDTAYVE
jgi:hypothetical protein